VAKRNKNLKKKKRGGQLPTSEAKKKRRESGDQTESEHIERQKQKGGLNIKVGESGVLQRVRGREIGIY